MIIYIAYWNYNNPKDIIIKKINAEYNEIKNKCSWDYAIIPDIYPEYYMINCGSEERAYFNKGTHYFVSGSLEKIKLDINNMINRRREYYKKKLDMIENINVVDEI